MDPMVAQLAAMRFARVQYASWGHPSTSGYPSIDYFLSSAAMEPPDGDEQYTERLVRLPGLSTPVSVTLHSGSVPARSTFGLPNDAMVFWCGQSLHKYLPAHDDVFPSIAKQVPDARFVFIEHSCSTSLTQRFKHRLSAAFRNRGLSAETACRFLPRMPSADFHAAMGCADVVLDSIGWSGCNTLLDALTHALPIVTQPGQSMRSRHGAAILQSLGLEDFVCESRAAYIEAAVALGKSGGGRMRVRDALNARHGRLEGNASVRALEEHIVSASRRVE
jgi:protein O-GlcNAc transferase